MSANQLILEGVHCSMEFVRPVPGVVVLTIRGNDIGELGNRPFCQLSAEIDNHSPIDLFVDAAATNGASMNVSAVWALWLRRNRNHLRQVTLVTRSRFVQVTANFVRQFANLHGCMNVTSDRDVFEEALDDTVRYRSNSCPMIV